MKNKKIVISLIAILVVLIILGIIFYKLNNTYTNINNNTANTNSNPEIPPENINANSKDNSILDNAYIDIWRNTSLDTDVDLFSKGNGENEQIYLGTQPVHYLINKNGDVHTYQDSSFQNILTGEREPATIKYIKTLSQSELTNLENDLKSTISTNASTSITLDSWYIKINGNSSKVNVNVQRNILNNYL